MGMQMDSGMGMVTFAAAVISLALVFYTIGVFAERRSGTLKPKHLALFWTGFVFDTTGTTIMTLVASANAGAGSQLHAITGVLALSLMLFHAVWATIVVVRGNDRSRANFHRLSICVWLFWLVPYVVGLLMGIPALHFGDFAACVTAIVGALAVGVVLCIKANVARRQAAAK